MSVNARLLLAARNGDSAALARELKQGAAVNARNRLGETALLIALKKNELGMAKTMLEAGADVNLAAVNGVTPLMAAAFAGQVEMVVALLGRGADVNAVDRLKKNAMTYAAGEGRTEIVKILLAKGVDPNGIYNNDLTALMWAAGFGKTDYGQGAARSRRPPGVARQSRHDGPRHGARGQVRRDGEGPRERPTRLSAALPVGSVDPAPPDSHPREQPIAMDERMFQRAANVQRNQGRNRPARREMHACSGNPSARRSSRPSSAA